MVLIADNGARRTATAGEGTLHNQRRVWAERKLVAALPKVLETGFVNDGSTDDLGVADLDRLFAAMGVVSHRGQRELPDARVVLVAPLVLVANGQGIA